MELMEMGGNTHVRVPADLLDDGVIKVTSVADKAAADLVRVLEALEDIAGQFEAEAALAQLQNTLVLVLGEGLGPGIMDAVDPRVVVRSGLLVDVVLELDDVCARHLLSVRGRQNGSSIAVDGLRVESRRRRGDCRQRKSNQALHCDGIRERKRRK